MFVLEKESLREQEAFEKRQRLHKKYIETVVKQAEGISESYQDDLEKVGDNFSRLEKKASDSWKNIGKSSDSTLKEQQSGIANWLNVVQANMNKLSTDSQAEFKKLGTSLALALKTPEAEEQISAIIEALNEASTAGSEAFEAMGQSITDVLDSIAAREQTLLDNIENYANQIIGIQEKVENYRRSINQEQMSDLEVYQDNKLRAEELFAQASQRSFEASQKEGEEKQKVLEEEKALLEEAFDLTKKLTASRKQEADYDKKSQQERGKAAEKQKKVLDLYSKEKINHERIAKLRQEISDHNEKALKYDKEQISFQNNLVTTEQSRADRLKLIQEYQNRAVKNRENMISAAESELKSWEKITKEAEKLQGKVENLSSFLREGLVINADFSQAEADLDSFQTKLKSLSSSSDGNFSLDFDMSGPIKQAEDQIVKIGDTWTTTWSKAEKDAHNAIYSVNKVLDDKSKDFYWEVKFVGSGSETLPISKKIESIKQKLQDLIVSDIVVNILLTGYEKLITQLDTIIGKFNQIKDKEVNIKVSYGNSESEPEKRKTGGRISGYGGGDKHPVLAEGGEWFIRKEAVKKYGDSLFSALNNMTLPRFQTGGKLLATAPSLNSVGNLETNNIVNNWNLTIGTETYAPRGKVKSIAEQLIAEVRGVY